MMVNLQTKQVAITAENQFTAWAEIDSHGRDAGASFTAALADDSTTLSCTWVVQARRVLADGTKGSTIDIFTSGAASRGGVQTAALCGLWEVRIGVKTGGFTTGSGVASIDW